MAATTLEEQILAQDSPLGPKVFAGLTQSEIEVLRAVGFEEHMIAAGDYEGLDAFNDPTTLRLAAPLEVFRQLGSIVRMVRRESFPNYFHHFGVRPNDSPTEDVVVHGKGKDVSEAIKTLLSNIYFHHTH